MEFDSMMDVIHLDEKWFYLTKTTRKFYLVPGEKEPDRKCKSKRAVARPRYVDDTGIWWGGKIGTWPFVNAVAAVRSSVNRPAGTIETKSVSVTKDVYPTFLLEVFLPAVVARWSETNRIIKLQHDNAPSHVKDDDSILLAAFEDYKSRGWSFSLNQQPPNSPDMNILGSFAATARPRELLTRWWPMSRPPTRTTRSNV
ncbi:Aste57867_24159 [Aphanomyces stellatus]|uniref:Aste57867_24159 protein n=1 Tax=Aphanomyces stellatus TaxID=120398 RepID=A0A485LQF4_9STRA|nr:hypothetical protein As57867_024085 [Aphanomyces stellatus]VFU00801.1 Aste57867_24159 [Aphanomyces stellatus]